MYQLTKPVSRLGLKGAQPVELPGGTISGACHLLLSPAPQFGDLGFSLPPLLLQLTLTFRRRCAALLNELPCLGRRSSCLLDVTYAGSPLVGEHLGSGVPPPAPPGPGDRFPGRETLTGTAHYLLIFGTTDAAGVERLHRRWRGLVDIVRGTGDPPAPSGALLVRPDGHVGFRATPADAAGLAALDTFLDSYLVPAPI